MKKKTLTVVLALGLALPTAVLAQDGILANAERLASEITLQPPSVRQAGGSPMKIITTLAMVGTGIGLTTLAKPDYVPSQYVPGNYPNRVDLSAYLGEGTYTGHSYRLVHRRGDEYGRGWAGIGNCPNRISCLVTQATLNEAGRRMVANYAYGYTDGYDDGRYEGLVAGHAEGFTAGQQSVIQIMDANGFVVYDGVFDPETYVQETFSDKAELRLAGIGLAAAGAVIALVWPDSPARNLDLGYMPGGARVGASFGF